MKSMKKIALAAAIATVPALEGVNHRRVHEGDGPREERPWDSTI